MNRRRCSAFLCARRATAAFQIEGRARNSIASAGTAPIVFADSGTGMYRNAQGRQRWRRLTACILICALFVHGIAFAMSAAMAGAPSGAPLSADAASATDWAGFALCRHDNAASEQPGDPGGPAGDTHCVFCVAGPGFILEPPAISTVFCPVEISATPWPLVAWRLAPT